MPIDFDALVNRPLLGVFGEPGVFYRPGHGGQVVTGVFDARHYEIDDQGQASSSTLVTTFAFRPASLDLTKLGVTALVPGPVLLSIRDKSYRVSDLKPDAQGMTVAYLERVGA